MRRFRSFDIQVYYRGAWVSVAQVSDEDFARYLSERPAAYTAARDSLNAKLNVVADANLERDLELMQDEFIIYEDFKYHGTRY